MEQSMSVCAHVCGGVWSFRVLSSAQRAEDYQRICKPENRCEIIWELYCWPYKPSQQAENLQVRSMHGCSPLHMNWCIVVSLSTSKSSKSETAHGGAGKQHTPTCACCPHKHWHCNMCTPAGCRARHVHQYESCQTT